MIKVAVLLGYVALSLAGLYNMKRADAIVGWQFAAGFAMYVAGFGVWLMILRMYPLSFAFPLAAGALVVGTQLVGFFFLGEGMQLHRLAGSGLILAGLACLAVFERGGG
jgi:multidrug transporter EmrE-like cation transporter